MNNFLCLPPAGSAPNAPPAGTSGRVNDPFDSAGAGFADTLSGVMCEDEAHDAQPEDLELAGLLAAMQAQSAWLVSQRLEIQLSPQQLEIVQTVAEGAGDALTAGTLSTAGGDLALVSQIQQVEMSQMSVVEFEALLGSTGAAQDAAAQDAAAQDAQPLLGEAGKAVKPAVPADAKIEGPDELASGQIPLPPELLTESEADGEVAQFEQASPTVKSSPKNGVPSGQVEAADTVIETPLETAATLRPAEPMPPNAGPPVSGAPSTGAPSAAATIIDAEPDRLAEAHHTEILEQISSSLEKLGRSGGSSLRIQLHPEHLGRIDLHLAQRAEGLHVNLIAEQAGTGTLIERHAIELQQSLLEAGVNLAGLSIGHGNAQRGRGQGNQLGSRRSYPANPTGGTADRLIDGLQSRGRVWNSTAQVDYRI